MESRNANAADWLNGTEFKHSYASWAGTVGAAEGEAFVKAAARTAILPQGPVGLGRTDGDELTAITELLEVTGGADCDEADDVGA